MQIFSFRRLLPVLVTVALLSGTYVHGYVSEGHLWPTTVVSYYVNPASMYVSQSAAISAAQTAAAGWSQQTRANIRLQYAGTTNGTSLTLNSKNEVFFRNATSGNIAETYYWWDGAGTMVDADIVLYEGSYHFYTGSGCTDGIYVEDVLIHEFGHVLGLAHSGVAGATMYPSMPGYCDMSQLSLDPDDISGLESLYPPSSGASAPTAPAALSVAQNAGAPASSLVLSWADTSSVESGFRIERSTGGSFSQVGQVGTNVTTFTNTGLAAGTTYTYRVVAYNSTGTSPYSNTASGQTAASTPTNTAPSVTMSNPLDNSSYPDGATISFSATAMDNQDGNISGNLRWTSSLMGSIGNGASFSRTLTAGTHVITAAVTDAGGMTGSTQVSMTVTVSASPAPAPTPTASISLSATSTTVKNKTKVALNWSGSSASRVDVFRNNSRVTTTSNSGSWTDSVQGRSGSYSYRVCDAGTSNCSNTATVSW